MFKWYTAVEISDDLEVLETIDLDEKVIPVQVHAMLTEYSGGEDEHGLTAEIFQSLNYLCPLTGELISIYQDGFISWTEVFVEMEAREFTFDDDHGWVFRPVYL